MLVLLLTLSNSLLSSGRNQAYSLTIRGTYNSTSKLFPNPNSPLETLRNQSIEMNDAFGFGVELRRKFPMQSFEIGLGVEWIRTTRSGLATVPAGPARIQLPVTDGYRFSPVELTGYLIAPFSSERIKFFMGGGVGFYYGERIFQVVDKVAQSEENPVAFGIHVLTGVDYFINRYISVRGEMKFWDPQFEMSNKFVENQVEYGGRTYRLSQQPFQAKVNLDGLVVTLGVVLNY